MRERTVHGLHVEGRSHPSHRHRPDGPPGHRRHHARPDDERGHAPRGFRHQVRRGAVREALLRRLAEQPTHGYQLMQDLAERSGGRWRPSAGSIYPTLQQLEDEGLVAAQDVDGRRVFALTEAGRTAAAGLSVERPWPSRTDGARDLHRLAREVGIASMQVSRMGSPEAVESAAALLTTARRDLYRLLADEPTTEGSNQDASAAD